MRDEIILAYDGTQQCIIEKRRTPIGTQYRNICSHCQTRTTPERCRRFFDCLAKADRPGAPWCHSWTSFTYESRRKPKVMIEPTAGCDPRTGYKMDKDETYKVVRSHAD